MIDIDRMLENRERRRFASDQRAWDKMGRQQAEAEHLVGQLCREGETVYYINVRSKTGRLTGATREFSKRFDAVQFLIRNRYV